MQNKAFLTRTEKKLCYIRFLYMEFALYVYLFSDLRLLRIDKTAKQSHCLIINI